MNTDKIFWREDGKKAWRTGWICERVGHKIRIGAYIGAPEHASIWYDKEDINMEPRS